jgi:aminoglycoside phosphotransferase (APT) family kinase protein
MPGSIGFIHPQMAEIDSLDSFRRQLLDDGAIEKADAVLTPLRGGVSSDIYKVEDGEQVFVVKRALAQLKVADEWFADVSRNRFELAYLQRVGEFLPETMPKVVASNSEQGWFAMEYLEGFANWKMLLLKGYCDPEQARTAGRILGTIHRKTWDNEKVRVEFESTENFHQLRIEPYLLTTADRTGNKDLAKAIRTEAERLRETRRCLVHGDYSPKNLLFQGDRLVVLDCEVAWFGDPTFDVAFLLNHLLLKAIHLDDRAGEFVGLALAAWDAYQKALERKKRISAVSKPLCTLLPMLMLARVDGKSPVEYLTDEKRQQLIRDFATEAILEKQPGDPNELMIDWLQRLH